MKTAECVTPKHPDKMCDQISDAILDLYLSYDPVSRVAVETLGGHGKVVIMGEVTSKLKAQEDQIKEIVARITGTTPEIEIRIVEQSPEIAQGVDAGGAGDQGIMIGFACNENVEKVPQEYYLARLLCKFLFERYPYDGKTQITLNENNDIKTVVASFQNTPKDNLVKSIEEWLKLIYNQEPYNIEIYANPAGDWNVGGFDADTGLTGRKLMVDNYGPNVSIGGGCFSGKDATKVDRSGAYMARKIAVDLLEKYDALRVKVKLAYAIGLSVPVMAEAIIEIEPKISIKKTIKDYDLSPQGIKNLLELEKPQYEETAKRGHFGNNFKWDGC